MKSISHRRDAMPVDRELPLTSLQSVILTTGPLVFLWTYLSGYVARKGRLGWAGTLIETHNFVVASISLALAAYVLDIGHNLLGARTGYQVDPYILGYIYHLLKIYEYFDIILAVLAGKTISKYAAFTHLFLPYWSYFRIIDRPYGSTDWRLQVIADCSARFLSCAVPWLVEDVTVEATILNMVEEGRWYADLAIEAIWAVYLFQGQRNSDSAIRIFGTPYDDEITARLLSVGVLLYASYAKRKEDAAKAPVEVGKKKPRPSNNDGVTAKATSSATQEATRTAPKKRR